MAPLQLVNFSISLFFLKVSLVNCCVLLNLPIKLIRVFFNNLRDFAAFKTESLNIFDKVAYFAGHNIIESPSITISVSFIHHLLSCQFMI